MVSAEDGEGRALREERNASGMDKAALIAEVAKRTGMAKAAVGKVVDAATAAIKDAVSKGQKVALVGFGTFERRLRAARTGRNPRTGQAVKVPPTKAPTFRPGAAFKSAVAGKTAARKVGGRKSSARRTARKR